MSRALGGIIQENFENLEKKDVDAVVEKTQREVMDPAWREPYPEFLNRVDELIMFRPLSQADVREIVKLQLHMLLQKLEEKDIHLIPSEELIAHISTTGFDPQILSRLSGIGARSIANDPEGAPEPRRSSRPRAGTPGRAQLSSADHRGHTGDRQGAGDRSRGAGQVVFDGRIVLRKPVDAKETEKANGNGKAKKSAVA